MADISRVDLASVEQSLARRGAWQAVADTAGHSDSESLVLRALGLMSIGQGDSAELQRMLAGKEEFDPSVQALALWADRRSGLNRHSRIAKLKELVESYPRIALPRLLLARAMVEERTNPRGAIDECVEVLRLNPDSCLRWSYLALGYFSSKEPLQALRSIDRRSSCPPTVMSLQVEMMASLAVKEWSRGTKAYESRCELLGTRSFPRLFRVWAIRGRLLWVAFGLVAAAGIGLVQPIPFALGMIALATLIPIARHVTRSWRPAIVVLVELALLGGLYLLNLLT
jgi:hypothetical protein